MSKIRDAYNRIDGRIVSSLDGSRINGKFHYPTIPQDKQREYFIREYFRTQPSVGRELILVSYLYARNVTFHALKFLFKKIRNIV